MSSTEPLTAQQTISAERANDSYWSDVWRFRSLIFRLAQKDILLRYRQTIIGAGWVLARPLLTTIVLVMVFGKLANLSSEGVPYPVFVFAAIVPWQLATQGTLAVSSSVVANANLIGKVYFPRLIIPISSVGPSLIDFGVSMILFAGIAIWYGCPLLYQLAFLPVLVLLTVFLIVGVGLWMSGISARYRDVIQGLPFVIQFGLYISPVGYGSHVVPEQYKLLYALNPMAGIIDGFRWCTLGVEPYWPGIWITSIICIAVMVSGAWFFRSQEETFADVL